MKYYTVKKGETLETLAIKFDIQDPQKLREFHNKHCALEHLIGKDVKPGFILCVPEFENIENHTPQQNQNLALVHLMPYFYASNYEVTEKLTQQNDEELEISHSTSINLREITDRSLVVEMQNYNFKKNKQTPDDKITELSLACMESIYPLSFKITAQGKIKELYNHKNLIKKFETKKPNLENFFVGKINTSYINNFYTNIKNETHLLKQLQSILLYQVLFPEKEWFLRKKEWIDGFYLIPNTLPVNCLFYTEYNFENPDEVETIIKGKIEKDCSLQELLNKTKSEELSKDIVTGNIEIHYTTSKQTKQLKSIEANIILLCQEELYQKQNLLLEVKE